VELSPFEFLDSWADLIPPPRKHRHRDQGAFAPNHPLRPAVTAPAIGNAAIRGTSHHAGMRGGPKPHTHTATRALSHPPTHTSRIAWAKLMARVGEEFPLACPSCGGDIRLPFLRPTRCPRSTSTACDQCHGESGESQSPRFLAGLRNGLRRA